MLVILEKQFTSKKEIYGKKINRKNAITCEAHFN